MTRNPVKALIWLGFSLLAWPWPAGGQVAINEVLVKNETTLRSSIGFETYVELYNASTSAVSLAGWTLTDSLGSPAKFAFPAEAAIPANGYVLVWCDKAIYEPGFHADFKLNGATDDLGLFFNGTNLMDYVAFGIQVPDLSISRIPDGFGAWQLGRPTPTNANLPIAMGTPLALRINEWMAASSETDDWLEIYNPSANGPVSLSGLILSDSTNPALAALARPIPNLSFIKPNGFIRFWADDFKNHNYDANHLGFKLSKSGDSISLYGPGASSLIDRVDFGPQITDVSMGRLPDGSTNITAFPLGSSSPEYSNYLPITNVVVNELLAHADPPLENAVELYNPTAIPVDISYWWLSNDQDQPQKCRLPAGTVIGPFGFKVFYEYTSWNRYRTGIFPEFTFDAARGGEFVLSSGNSLGNLTGYRMIQSFGVSINGVAFGRHVKSDGSADFVPMSDLSLGTAIRAGSPDTPQNRVSFESGPGAPNPYPLVGPIVISEIMYHPQDYLIGTNWVDNTWDEFIELHNVSTNDVPLYDLNYPFNTWRLRDAVDFDFPPWTVIPSNGYLAVIPFDPVSYPGAFAAFCGRYHVGTNFAILGPYRGKLANKGDNLELWKPDAPNVTGVPYALVERVGYLASAPWPELEPSGGVSLHRVNLTGYANDPTNWIGAVPTLLKAKPSLVINEILARADPPLEAAIELANPTAAPADLSNWWLSNDQNEPTKYRIPTNTIIAPFGFKVFYESEFNPDGNGISPRFALDSVHGGEVVLASAAASGELTGYWLREAFGPTEKGVPLGRYVNSDGRAEWVPMSARSLGTTNPNPLVGPIVISEIMYHPPDMVTYSNNIPVMTDNTVDEYIELQNLTTNTVPLYSTAANAPQQFTNTWRLTNAVGFDFPLFVSLPPKGRLLVVNFNPTANPAQQIQFRSKFNVPADVRLFGPLVGSLKNRSGAIELCKPGPVQTPPSPDAGFVPYFLVEKVSYEDRAPWPTNADGHGCSLQRLVATAYADDPTNWFGAQPTGGRRALPEAHITGQPPASVMVATGSNVTLTAVAEGAGMISYQWYFNGLALPNATANWLSLTNLQPANQGTYQLVASNAFGIGTSATVQLTVAIRPSFLVLPPEQIVMLGERLQLPTTVTGTPPFGFTWWRYVPSPSKLLATHADSGSTDSFEIPNALMSDAGGYRVYVTNLASLGGVSSSIRRVAVVQPLGERMVLAGSNIAITANVGALGTLFYRWQFNGTNLPGATTTTLILTNVQSDQGGFYQLLLSTSSAFTGLVRSVSCQLTVQTTATAPEIVQQPVGLRLANGSTAWLQVVARGTDPLSYQWWHNQTNLISSGTNSFLEFANVAAQDLGAYLAVVSNQVGVTTSMVARLVGMNDRSGAPQVSSISAASTNTLAFSFETKTGFTYQVEYKTDLTAADWRPLGPPHPGDGSPVVIRDAMAGASQRYYRVLLLP